MVSGRVSSSDLEAQHGLVGGQHFSAERGLALPMRLGRGPVALRRFFCAQQVYEILLFLPPPRLFLPLLLQLIVGPASGHEGNQTHFAAWSITGLERCMWRHHMWIRARKQPNVYTTFIVVLKEHLHMMKNCDDSHGHICWRMHLTLLGVQKGSHSKTCIIPVGALLLGRILSGLLFHLCLLFCIVFLPPACQDQPSMDPHDGN